MTDESQKTEYEIVLVSDPLRCHLCGGSHEVRIVSIKSDDDRWLAKGKGNIGISECIACGMTYTSIMHAISIQCAPFPCPSCGRSQNLQLKLQNINVNLADDSYEFEVEMICSKCSKKGSIKKILKRLLEIINIEVGPSGITIKKH